VLSLFFFCTRTTVLTVRVLVQYCTIYRYR
jgi:hypothetical protein